VAGPYLSAYHASKYAVIGFSNSLRDEMQQFFNIWVSAVLPSFTKTPLYTGAFENAETLVQKWNLLDNKDDIKIKQINNTYNAKTFIEYLKDGSKLTDALVDEYPGNVVNSVIYALASVFPLRFYYPNWQASLMVRLNEIVPSFIVDKLKYFLFFRFCENNKLLKNKK